MCLIRSHVSPSPYPHSISCVPINPHTIPCVSYPLPPFDPMCDQHSISRVSFTLSPFDPVCAHPSPFNLMCAHQSPFNLMCAHQTPFNPTLFAGELMIGVISQFQLLFGHVLLFQCDRICSHGQLL